MTKVWIDGKTQVEVIEAPGVENIYINVDGKTIRWSNNITGCNWKEGNW